MVAGEFRLLNTKALTHRDVSVTISDGVRYSSELSDPISGASSGLTNSK